MACFIFGTKPLRKLIVTPVLALKQDVILTARFLVPVRLSWWHHQMETFSALLAICAGNSLVTGEFPTQRPVTRSFDIFFDLRLNKRLSKQSWGWWFEIPLCPLWCHCNDELLKLCPQLDGCIIIPPPNEVGGGVYWIHLVRPSVRPSVRLSVDDMVSGA